MGFFATHPFDALDCGGTIPASRVSEFTSEGCLKQSYDSAQKCTTGEIPNVGETAQIAGDGCCKQTISLKFRLLSVRVASGASVSNRKMSVMGHSAY